VQHKCEQYWPEAGKRTYGLITVEIMDSEQYADFVVRTFTLSKVSFEQLFVFCIKVRLSRMALAKRCVSSISRHGPIMEFPHMPHLYLNFDEKSEALMICRRVPASYTAGMCEIF
jgi:hypothetical protein